MVSRGRVLWLIIGLLPAFLVASAAQAAAPSVNFSGIVLDSKGGGLVDPYCLYLWQKDVTAPDGWSTDNLCYSLGDAGEFALFAKPGDYKVQVEAGNVLTGMFVGGMELTKAKVFTLTAKTPLKGLVFKVDVMTKVTGVVTANNSRSLVNPYCAYFWAADKTAEGGFRQPDGCADIDASGAFTAYLAPGTYKVQILADNVADAAFAGPDGSLKNGTAVKVAAATISNLSLKIVAQAKFAGRFVNADGSSVSAADSLHVWIPTTADANTWVDSGDAWEFGSKGAFLAYLSPGAYRFQVAYTNGRSTFYGGDSISTATTISVPDIDLSTLVMRLGKGAQPPTASGASVIPWDGSLQAVWNIDNGNSAAFTTVTAQPGGFSCATTGAMCTLRGLKNGTRYDVSMLQQNEAGAVVTALGTAVPAIPTPRLVLDPQVVIPGAVSVLKISNVAANTKFVISGTLGISNQTVTTGALGTAAAVITFPNAGISAVSVTGPSVKALTNAYVAALKVPSTAKAGQAVSLAASGLPPGATVVLTAGTQTLSGKVGTKGLIAGTFKFAKAGRYATSVKVGSLVVPGGTVVVS